MYNQAEIPTDRSIANIRSRELRIQQRNELIKLLKEVPADEFGWVRSANLPHGPDWVRVARENPKTFEYQERSYNDSTLNLIRLHHDITRGFIR